MKTTGSRREFELTPIDDGRADTPLDWVVKGYVERSATTVFYGYSGTAKTFILLHLALCIVTGMSFYGHKTKKGAVIIAAGEGTRSLKRRIRAWQQHHRPLAPEERENLLFMAHGGRHVTMRVLDGSREGNTSSLIGSLGTLIETHNEARPDMPVRAVIFDTMATTFGMFEETNEQISKAISAVNHELAHPYGCAVIACHHTGKDQTRGARGGYSLVCDADAVYLVRRADLPEDKFPDTPFNYETNNILLECKKMKDAEAPAEIKIGAYRVILGTDDDGEPITSLAVGEPSLSERLVRVLHWLRANWSLSDIASTCGLSVKQVRGDIQALMAGGHWSKEEEDQRKLKNRGGRPKASDGDKAPGALRHEPPDDEPGDETPPFEAA